MLLLLLLLMALQGLVVEDLAAVLPEWLIDVPHIIVRRGEGELVRDAQLKLRCANATHTAVVYTMALSAHTSIAAACAAHPHLLLFLDRLYEADISSLPRAPLSVKCLDVRLRQLQRARVAAASVDMSPFWVAQNAVAKVMRSTFPQYRCRVTRFVAGRLGSGWFPPLCSMAARHPTWCLYLPQS